jgi:hypothetical protein
MEISIPANKIDTRNIYFMEKKKNVIVDGDFIKILYSTPEFEMHGLYVFAEFETAKQMHSVLSIRDMENHSYYLLGGRQNATLPQKKYIVFNPSTIENASVIQLLCQIESSIIDRYIQKNCPGKIASYILKTQLMNGIIKYHSENATPCPYSSPGITSKYKMSMSIAKDKIILKISGVWETTTHVGITMKFISVS